MNNNDYLNVIPLGIGALVIVLIYLIWTFFSTEKPRFKNFTLLQLTENLVFILIFSILVIISGAQESQYKLLFLFIVITSTIQSGIKHSMIVSCTSSMIVLGIDLIYGNNTSINQNFENDLILCSIFILTSWLLGYYVKIEKEYAESLANLVNIDGLTEVYNHRFFHDALKKVIEEAEKEKYPIQFYRK